MTADEVPIKNTKTKLSSYKKYFCLLIIFIIIMSNTFIDNCLASFGESAVKGREVSSWGIILQGLFMIFFYIVALHMMESNIM